MTRLYMEVFEWCRTFRIAKTFNLNSHWAYLEDGSHLQTFLLIIVLHYFNKMIKRKVCECDPSSLSLSSLLDYY